MLNYNCSKIIPFGVIQNTTLCQKYHRNIGVVFPYPTKVMPLTLEELLEIEIEFNN